MDRFRLWTFSGGDQFLLGQGLGVKEGLQRRLADRPGLQLNQMTRR